LLVTFAQFATIKGVTKGAVTAAIRTDRIGKAVVEQDGKKFLDKEMALELWDKNTRPTHNSKISGSLKVIELPVQEDVEHIPDLNESRAKREHYLAELAKLQVEEQKGLLVPADEVKKKAYGMGRIVRDALMTLADRICHEVAAEADPITVREILEREHRNVLKELAARDD
tara:strand:+ start:292 stop:804 length:513 start_codon:yes stop_codon:yes gene_type:complete